MKIQKGFIQIIIALAITAILLIVVLKYFSNIETGRNNESQDLDIDIDSAQSPRGIIEDTEKNIKDIEDRKNKEIQDYLNN